ncbi:MAG: glycosyltransferase, partial [Candidatus Hydrogenedentes bacterium]|nr:glycosyltransferase [Candidatus Hydrogenedentota bacterium]
MRGDLCSISEKWTGLRARLAGKPVSGRVCVVESRSGDLTLRVDGRYVHSSYDPVKEASRRVANCGVRGDRPVIVLGLGLGWHLRALLGMTTGRVVVIEADEEVAAAAANHMDISGPDADRCVFYVGREPSEIAADSLFRESVEAGSELLRFEPACRIDPGYYDRVERSIHSLADGARFDQLRVFVVGPIYGGSVPVARYTAAALKRLGHHVEFMDCSEYKDAFESIKKTVKSAGRARHMESMFVSFLAEMAVVRAAEFGSHLVLALAQAPLHEGAVRALRKRGIVTAFWFVENYRQLDYWRQMAPEYDFFFTIQSGAFFEKLDALGVRNYACVHTGCDPEIHRPLDLDETDRAVYGADISFAGAAYHNRLVTFESLADKDFKLWGINWSMSPLLAPLVQNEGRPFTTDEMVKMFNGSKISLNLHSSNQSDCIDPEGDFFNPRLFEIAACGGFQLTDARAGFDSLFEPETEIVTFTDAVDLRRKVEYYLEHEDERRAIAERARKRAVSEHTYDRRLKEMLAFIADKAGDRLAARPPERFWTAGEAAGRPELPPDFKEFLKTCPDDTPCTLRGLLPHVGSGDTPGPQDLSEPEGLLLLLQEIVAQSKI